MYAVVYVASERVKTASVFLKFKVKLLAIAVEGWTATDPDIISSGLAVLHSQMQTN